MKLLARRQYDAPISSTDGQQIHGHNLNALLATARLTTEQNPFRSNLSLQSSARKPTQNERIQGMPDNSEVSEKRKQSSEENMSKKHQDMLEAEYSDPKPKRPLSAYNLFFQEERQKIVEDPKAMEKVDDDSEATTTTNTTTTDHCDPSESPKKRKRYEPHRKMSFEGMAKTIAKRWKEISSDESKIQRYQEIAKIEKARYMKEVSEWKLRRRQRISCK